MQSVCTVLWCHLWCLWLHHHFWHLINGTIFGKKKSIIEHKMCVLISSETFSFEIVGICLNWILLSSGLLNSVITHKTEEFNISHKKNLVRFYHKCIHVFMWSTHYSYWILMKQEFSWQFLKHTQISRKSVQWEVKFCADRHTDRNDGDKRVAFHNFVKVPKNVSPLIPFTRAERGIDWIWCHTYQVWTVPHLIRVFDLCCIHQVLESPTYPHS